MMFADNRSFAGHVFCTVHRQAVCGIGEFSVMAMFKGGASRSFRGARTFFSAQVSPSKQKI